jgi:energy-coupling factor transporter ATP-binding protein EcfA2
MSAWESYPKTYREREINLLLSFEKAGECAAVVGLSGSGKSNLLGFIANRLASSQSNTRFVMVDCNRLMDGSRTAFFRMLRRAMEPTQVQSTLQIEDELSALEESLGALLRGDAGLCFLLDRFDSLYTTAEFSILASNLRALRDRFKYQLTYLIGARRPMDDRTELAELFFGHTLWLGPLSRSDAIWSARRDAQRFAALSQVKWDAQVLEKLVDISWGFPSLLRAVCEAYAGGAQPELSAMSKDPAVTRRVAEFWADAPDSEMIRLAGLEAQPLLLSAKQPQTKIDVGLSELTAKEHLLLEYLQSHVDEVCSKDDLVHAVWSEDVIYEQGIRDESLAQLVRRLRVKIEPNPNEPHFIQTIPGRGYLFRL